MNNKNKDGRYGYCWCGCGELTELAPRTVKGIGWIRGEPKHYRFNHHRRKSGRPWREEDRGYKTPCWIWLWSKYKLGYARVYLPDGKCAHGHRYYYEKHHGALPDGYAAHHLCRVTSCVNPDHIAPLPWGQHASMHMLENDSENAKKARASQSIESLRGPKWTDEDRRRMSESRKGRKHTAESREKIRQGLLKYWAERRGNAA